MQETGWAWVVTAALLASAAAGCSCSSGTGNGADTGSGGADTCTPPADDPMRGTACTATSTCPSGYTCQHAFGTGMACDITCTPASQPCVCPAGLTCEVPAGAATGICS